MPYLAHPKFLSEIKYLKNQINDQIVIVTGPRGTGKSSFMYNYSRDLIRSGYLSLTIDVRQSNTIEELLKAVKLEIISVITQLKPYFSNDQKRILAEMQKKPNVLKGNVQISGINQFLHVPAQDLLFSLESILFEGSLSIKGVWNFFNTLEKYSLSLQPVLFIHNADALYLNPNFVELFNLISSKMSRTPRVPIFLEIHDTTVLTGFRNESIYEPFTRNSLRILDTGSLTEEDTTVLIKSNIFSRSEFKKIIKMIGVQGGAMDQIYNDLKFGISIDDAIARVLRKTERRVSKIIEKINEKFSIGKNGKQKNEFNAAVKNLCQGEKFTGQMLSHLDELFQEGDLTVDESFAVRFANKGVSNVLCS